MPRRSSRSTLMHLYRRLNNRRDIQYGGTENTEFSILDLLSALRVSVVNPVCPSTICVPPRNPRLDFVFSPAFLLIREDLCKSVVASAFDFGVKSTSPCPKPALSEVEGCLRGEISSFQIGPIWLPT